MLPGPGAAGHGGLLAGLIARGHARVEPGRRGLDVASDGGCRARDGSLSAGLSAIGRPTEDSVIGNDTLSRSLHPHADRWARRVVQRGSAGALATRHPRRRSPCAHERRRHRERARRMRGRRRAARRGSSRGRWRSASGPRCSPSGSAEHGSPLNVIDPAPVGRNAAELQRVADGLGVELRIFFARKANKALALVDEARRCALGIDVASERELRQVLARGVPAATSS